MVTVTDRGRKAREVGARGSIPSTGRDMRLAFSLAFLAVGMVGLSFAAVPLYRLYCQVTGFAGTTQRADAAPGAVLARRMLVRFDANVSDDLAWRFKPVVNTMEPRIGEQTLAFFEAENLTDHAITGTATFNVTPEIAGGFFSKIECFCFTEQTLKPGEKVQMPVTFYIDPEIVNDPDAGRLQNITLSYTFFPLEDDADEGGTTVGKVEGAGGEALPNG